MEIMRTTGFDRRLAILLNDFDSTYGELAIKIGVTEQAVSKWVSGICEPRYEKLIEISNYFGVSTDYLLYNGPRKKLRKKQYSKTVFLSHLGEILKKSGSNKALAQKLQVGEKTISAWKNGSRTPKYYNLAKICMLLNVSSDELLMK